MKKENIIIRCINGRCNNRETEKDEIDHHEVCVSVIPGGIRSSVLKTWKLKDREADDVRHLSVINSS